MRVDAFRILLPALALAAGGAVLAQEPAPGKLPEPSKAKQQGTVEAETGIEFPAMIRASDGSNHVLAGSGAARKPGDKDPAYAVGIYIDEVKARAALARFQGKSAADLQRDADFHRQLASDQVAKTVRIELARDLEADALREWIDEAVQKQMLAKAKAQDASTKEEADMQAAKKLTELVPNSAKKGTVLQFGWAAGGRLTVTDGSRQLGMVESPAVSRALFEAFMGTDPISQRARSEAYRGIAERLHAKNQGPGAREEPATREEPAPKR
jgi:hypothetical protein